MTGVFRLNDERINEHDYSDMRRCIYPMWLSAMRGEVFAEYLCQSDKLSSSWPVSLAVSMK